MFCLCYCNNNKGFEKMNIFYISLSSVIVCMTVLGLILKFIVFKNNEIFKNFMTKTLKVLVVSYCVLMLVSVLLPDAFKLCMSEAELASMAKNYGYIIIRWFSIVSFIVLPIAVFYKSPTMRNVALLFCLPVAIASICFYPQFLNDFCSTAGRGINSISVVSQSVKNFLIDSTFRSVWFGILISLQILIPIYLSINERKIFYFESKKDILNFIICLPLIILSAIPIYVPQYLFGYSNIIFKAYGWVHICWFVFIILEIISLYFIFRKKDTNTKMVMLFTLALSLIMQYNQMFSAISINLKRLPLQLCNIGAFLILISLITKNKKIFNFTAIINVAGVIFALAVPDLEGKGLFYLYNMHFIFEHGNVIVVPILALMLNIFPRLDKYALRDCLIGFSIYFCLVWALGTTFNAIATSTGNNFYEVNYLFMFLPKVATDLLPFTKALFHINFTVGSATFYPVLQLIVYIVFATVCVLLYFAIRLIYKIKDKIFNKQNPDIQPPVIEDSQAS